MGFHRGEQGIRPTSSERNRNRLVRRVILTGILSLILGAAVLAAGCARERGAEGTPAAGPAITTPARPIPPTATPAVPGALSPGFSHRSHRQTSGARGEAGIS